MAVSPIVGQRVSYNGHLCTVLYSGPVDGTAGSWLGVEWDDAFRGKHDGSHKGIRYFTCRSKSPTAASFVRPNRPADRPQSFIAALRDKYVSDATEAVDEQVVISGKLAEQVGFDKIRRQQAQLKDLKIVILDGLCVNAARDHDEATVADTCPSILHLDLSRNLFRELGPVVDVCADLKGLYRLSLKYVGQPPTSLTLAALSPDGGNSGNRFRNVLGDSALARAESSFAAVTELALGENMFSWQELCHIAVRCPRLTTLAVGANHLSSLPLTNYHNLASTLTSINLEYNNFLALSDLASLASLKALRNLYLKGNNVKEISAPGATAAVFPSSLQYLDVSYNNVQEWSFVDSLATHFPGLTGLRLAHNPVYDKQSAETKAPSSEESHMFTVARAANLETVNFTHISPADRTNAELFYLSRIAKELAVVPESAEHTVIALHPRYAKLCETYGEPDIVRRDEINPAFLEARLVTVAFRFEGKGKKTSRIPKSFNIYAVKAIAGKLFGHSPLRMRLVWETGEWDPVAGYDEQDGESSDEGDDFAEPSLEDGVRRREEGQPDDKSARWLKREVELADGPKQLGYCVDGLNVSIRVETAEHP
ncbi:hypothetical protein RJ55_06151 [Drechmeria coniospora]|nr:hypothetical protein RJ55_06151 [Drechmeria coniospora]